MKNTRFFLAILASIALASCSSMCGGKGESGDGSADANPCANPCGDAANPCAANPVEAPKEPVQPLPPPQNDLTEVSVTKGGEDKVYKIGDRVTVTNRIGMISKRFNGVADVTVEPPHAGEVVAIRTDKGLLDIKWDAGEWRKHITPTAAKPGDPDFNSEDLQGKPSEEKVNLDSFVSPVHANYLVHEGDAAAKPQ